MIAFLKYSKYLACTLCATSIFMTSCGGDDDEPEPEPETTAPSTYNFENASYGGQTIRLDQLEVLTTEMKSANAGGVELDKTTLLGIFEGETSYFDFETGGKQLSNKADDGARPYIEAWIDSLVNASAQSEADPTSGARVLESADGAKSYLVAANGFEYTQLIEKGIMGAVFYYQGTSNYLLAINADDNTTILEGKDYTEMEHHFDEAFGYLGATIDFSSTNTDGVRYHAKYAGKGQDAGLNTIDDIMTAFIEARFAITENDITSLDAEVVTIKSEWEEVLYTTAIHYLKGASADFSDDALRCHQLSEAYAFIWSLKFNHNGSISATEVDEVLALLSDDFFAISQSNITAAQAKLVELFSVSSEVESAL